MTPTLVAITLLGIAAACAPAPGATQEPVPQDEAALRRDWLERDLARIATLQRLLPPTDLTPAELRAALGGADARADEALGFGGRRLHLAAYGGYTTHWIRVLVDESGEAPRVAAIEVDCSGSRSSWPRIQGELRSAWSLPVPDLPDEETLRYVWSDPERIRAIDAAHARALGPRADVEPPDALREHHAFLTDPLRFHDFGRTCYDDGAEPPGRAAIEALAAAGRLDLVRDVLRCANPTSRVYAAEALLALDPVPPGDLAALRAVRALPLPISSCVGCFVTSSPAAELLPELPR